LRDSTEVARGRLSELARAVDRVEPDQGHAERLSEGDEWCRVRPMEAQSIEVRDVIVVVTGRERPAASAASVLAARDRRLWVARRAVSASKPAAQDQLVRRDEVQHGQARAGDPVEVGELNCIPGEAFQDDRALRLVEVCPQSEAERVVGNVAAVVAAE
jgi:hypothetical protein